MSRGPTPRHRSPSKARYAAAHPSLTVHFDLETYARIVALRKRTGHSLNQLVRQGLGEVESNVKAIRARGYAAGVIAGRAAGSKAGEEAGRAAGFAAAVARFRLSYECAECHQPIDVEVGDEAADAAIAALSDWEHTECIE